MKKIIIGIVAAVVVLAGAGLVYATVIKKDDVNSEDQNQSTFNPASTDGQAVKATITVTPKNGKKTVTAVKMDGAGTSEYVIEGGSKSRLVFTKDFYYSCSKGNCVKIPSTAEQGFVADPSTYDISQAAINNAQKNATFEAQQPCPDGSGTCDVWKADGLSQDGSSATVYIDESSRRVVQINTENADGAKAKMVYEYKPVSIEIPENAREIKINVPSIKLE